MPSSRLQLIGDAENGYALKARLLGFLPITPPGMGGLSFFARDADDRTLIYVIGPGGQVELVATEIDRSERHPAWDAALGHYVLANPARSDSPFLQVDGVTLRYAQGVYQLTVDMPLEPQQLALSIVNDTEATLHGYGRGLGETILLEPDGSILHAGWRFERRR